MWCKLATLEDLNEIYFIESVDRKIWDTITNGLFIPMCEKDKVFSEKPWSQWTKSKNKKVQLD